MPRYDVFLSHNSADQDTVEVIAHRLREEAGLSPFLDRWHLIPGEPWQEAIEDALEESEMVAVFLGPSGVSPWHNEEMRAGLDRAVRGRDDVRVIPVLLPDADPATLPPFLSRRTYVDFRPGLDDDDAFDRLVAGILGQPPEQAEPFTLPDEPAPYPGLLPFTAQQAGFFFGRTDERERLLARVRELPFVAVVGASGSGKSSLVLAGLLPALDRGWHALTLVPGARPLRALADQLATLGPAEGRLRLADDLERRLAERGDGLSTAVSTLLADRPLVATLLIVVDQFEELFTHIAGPPEQVRRQQRQFVANLVDAAHTSDGRVKMVLTLRADFVRHCLDFAGLRALLEPNQLLLGPMGEDALREAIVKPAQVVSAMFEKGLVGRLMDDMRDQPAALPLLSFALAQLWRRRQGVWLTHAAYEDIGGVSGAIDQRADAVYDRLSESQKHLARNLFVRLVALGEGGSNTRRRVNRSELRLAGVASKEVDELIGILSHRDVRLIAADADTVELAHEALIEQWGQLHAWLDEDRAALRTHRRLTDTAREWEKNAGDESYFYRGARLAEAEEWAEAHGAEMSAQEQAFLEASVARRDWEVQEEERRRQRELEQAHRLAEEERKRAEEQAQAAAQLHRRALWLGGALIVAMVAMMVAVGFGKRATDNETVARTEEARAQAVSTRAIEAEGTAGAEATRAINAGNTAVADRATAQAESTQVVRAESTAQAERATAQAESTRAVNAEAMAESRALAAYAESVMEQDPHLAILLGLEAVYQTHQNTPGTMTMEACSALHHAVARSRLQATLRGHTNDVNHAAWSSDDGRIVTASDDGTARVWDAITGEALLTLSGHTDYVNHAAWSRDDGRIVTASRDGTAKVWNAITGEGLLTLGGHTGSVNHAAWSRDDGRIVTASGDGVAKVWNAITGEGLLTLSGHTDSVNHAAWSGDDGRIVTASRDGTAKVWNAITGEELLTLSGHTGSVNHAAWSGDDRRIVTASHDDTAKVWDANTGEQLLTLSGHTDFVWHAAWSGDDGRIVTASWDRTARVWDAATGEVLLTLSGHTWIVEHAAWSGDDTRIVTASRDGTAKVWDATTGEELLALSGHTGAIYHAAWSGDDGYIVTASSDNTAKAWDATTDVELFTLRVGSVHHPAWSGDDTRIVTAGDVGKVWNAATGEELLTLSGHYGSVHHAAWSGDDERIVTASWDGTAKVWDAATGKELLTLSGHTSGIHHAAWSGDDGRIVTASSDGTAKVWDATTGEELLTLSGHTDDVTRTAWSGDDGRIVTASSDGTAKVWDADTGTELLTLSGHTGAIYHPAWSGDDTRIVTAGDVGKVWNAATGEELLTLSGHTGWVLHVAWSGDDGRIVTTGHDNAARVWDADTGTELLTLSGHTGAIYHAAWSGDDGRIVTASEDRTAKVWDAATGEELLTLSGHTDYVLHVAWSGDDGRIVTASRDGSAHIYFVRVDDLIRFACSRTRRNMTRTEWRRYMGLDVPYRKTCPNLPEGPER